MTPEAARTLLDLITARDARDTLERACGWVVAGTHADGLASDLTLYGPFSEPAAALAWAANMESELNVDEEGGFSCTVQAIMPAL